LHGIEKSCTTTWNKVKVKFFLPQDKFYKKSERLHNNGKLGIIWKNIIVFSVFLFIPIFIVNKVVFVWKTSTVTGKSQINQSSEHVDVVVGPMMEKLSAAANTSVPGARFWDQVNISTLCSSVLDPWYFGTDPDPEPDPYLWQTDPAPSPAFLVSDLQDANKKILVFQNFFLLFLF
jgi:hypothetical protein